MFQEHLAFIFLFKVTQGFDQVKMTNNQAGLWAIKLKTEVTVHFRTTVVRLVRKCKYEFIFQIELFQNCVQKIKRFFL